MAVIHGRNIKIMNGSNVIIAGAKSCTIHKQADTIETSSATSATDKTFIPGRSEWSVEMSHLVMTAKGGLPLVRETYTLAIMVGTTAVYQGTAICTDASITATTGNLAQGTIKFKGSGALQEDPT